MVILLVLLGGIEGLGSSLIVKITTNLVLFQLQVLFVVLNNCSFIFSVIVHDCTWNHEKSDGVRFLQLDVDVLFELKWSKLFALLLLGFGFRLFLSHLII